MDFVSRGLFQETVPNSEPISIAITVEFYINLEHTSAHTTSKTNRKSFFFLKYLYVQSVCLYLVEERQEVFDRTHLFQSFSELPGVAR